MDRQFMSLMQQMMALKIQSLGAQGYSSPTPMGYTSLDLSSPWAAILDLSSPWTTSQDRVSPWAASQYQLA